METYSQFIWVGFFAAALLLKVTKRGNLAIILSLFVFGLLSLIFAFSMWGWIDHTVLEPLMQLVPLILMLLIFRVVILARSGSSAIAGRSVMQDAEGVNLATLFTPRNETNTYSRATILRDEVCARFVARAKSDGLEIIEQRSQEHSPSVWLRLDYLLPSPDPDLSLCASVSVEIERFDFHHFEHTFTVTVQVGTQINKISGLLSLDNQAVDLIQQHIVTPGQKLRLKNTVRQRMWQLWRPQNKVQRLKPDWLTPGLTLLAILLVMIPYVGIFLMGGILFWLSYRSKRRRTYILTSGKPFTDPRSLYWMDSWQISIGGLGTLSSAAKEGIMTRLKIGGPEGASIAVERIGYWGTDSWVEREQIVVRHRRAIGFIHIVPYGDVLYVAWECHINSASWVEQKIAEGVDRISGLNVVANRVVAGSHQLNEYDVSDSNFLAEWIHEAVKREVKLRMAEHKIDQEVDFTVQRESRKEALATSAQTSSTEAKPKTSRFKRLS